MEPWSPELQADSLPPEPQRNSKNTGVGNLSFLQQIFLIQGSNWGLLHCRPILYQLSDQGFTRKLIKSSFKVPYLQGRFFRRTLQCIRTIVYFDNDQWGLLSSLWFSFVGWLWYLLACWKSYCMEGKLRKCLVCLDHAQCLQCVIMLLPVVGVV